MTCGPYREGSGTPPVRKHVDWVARLLWTWVAIAVVGVYAGSWFLAVKGTPSAPGFGWFLVVAETVTSAFVAGMVAYGRGGK